MSTRAAYEEAAARYLRGEPVDGWEERSQTQRRVVTAAERLMEQGRDVLLVSHGLVLTLLLAWLMGVDAGTLVSDWRAMRFPDLCIADWGARQVIHPFGQPS